MEGMEGQGGQGGQQAGGLAVHAQEGAKAQPVVETGAMPQTREQRIESLLAEGAKGEATNREIAEMPGRSMAAGEFFAGFRFDGFQDLPKGRDGSSKLFLSESLRVRQNLLELTGDNLEAVLSPRQQEFLTHALDDAINTEQAPTVQGKLQTKEDLQKMLIIATYVNSLRK